MTLQTPAILRGKTLFYADTVNFVRATFPPRDYSYRDDFAGDLILCQGSDTLFVVEIKSEAETKQVSTKPTGPDLNGLRPKIHSLSCLDDTGNAKGWLSILAQCWHYMESGLPDDLRIVTFKEKSDVLIIPADKEKELGGALECLAKVHQTCIAPEVVGVRRPSENMTMLVYRHEELNRLFQALAGIE